VLFQDSELYLLGLLAPHKFVLTSFYD